MPAPSFSKTWQHNVNNLVAGNPDAITDHRTMLLGIINAMLGFGSSPWTVTSSSDSVTASNNDSVNRWTGITKLVWGRYTLAQVHSWIVLQQTGINAKTQVCFSLGINTTDGNQYRWMEIIFSPAAGFGAANGGTNGTTTARPTATDQQIIQTAGTGVNYWTDGPTAVDTWYYHVMQSTDGQCTRWVVCRNNAAVSFFICDRPRNPHAVWTSPAVAGFKGNGTSPASYGNWNDASTLVGRVAGVNTGIRLATEMVLSAMIGEYQAAPNSLVEWPLTCCGLRGTTTGARGFLGELFDIRWGSTARATGDTYPGSAEVVVEHSWAQFTHLVLPWPGVSEVPIGVG